MDEERNDIEILMARVEQMRAHQRDFFSRKSPVDKKLAIAKEHDLDELLRHLRRKGYDPDRFKTNTVQKKLL